VLARLSAASELPRDFAEAACDGSGGARLCLYRRPGACTASDAPFLIDAVLKRIDQ
jgi:hypothetical protein